MREWQEKLIQGLMMKSCVKALAVPTITYDMVVQTCLLRKLGEPVTLFREKAIEGHERLMMIMAKLDAVERQLLMKAPHKEEEKEEAVASAAKAKANIDEETIQYPFYTRVTSALRNARVDIAKWEVVVTHIAFIMTSSVMKTL